MRFTLSKKARVWLVRKMNDQRSKAKNSKDSCRCSVAGNHICLRSTARFGVFKRCVQRVWALVCGRCQRLESARVHKPRERKQSRENACAPVKRSERQKAQARRRGSAHKVHARNERLDERNVTPSNREVQRARDVAVAKCHWKRVNRVDRVVRVDCVECRSAFCFGVKMRQGRHWECA